MDIESKDSLKDSLMSRLDEFTVIFHDLILELIADGDLWITTRRGEPNLYFIIGYEEDEIGNMVTKDFSLEDVLRESFGNNWSQATDTYGHEVRVIIDWLRDLAEKLDSEFGDSIEPSSPE